MTARKELAVSNIQPGKNDSNNNAEGRKADRDSLITLYRERDQHTVGAQQVACDQPVVYFFPVAGYKWSQEKH